MQSDRASGLVGCFSLVAIGLAPAAVSQAEVFRPAETADAVLIQENQVWDRRLHDLLRLPAWIDLALEHRTRFELRDDPFRPGESRSDTQYPQRTRLRLGIDGPGPLRFLGEMQDARTHSDGPNDFTGAEIDRFDVLQLFVSATLRDVLGSGLRADAHVGRLTLDVGSRRLLARNSFRNTTNAFDGVHVQIGREKAWRLRALYTRPVVIDEGPFDDDDTSRTRLWGIAYEDRRNPWFSLDAYYLGLADRVGQRRYTTFGARLFHPAQPQQLDYELELIGQLGNRGTRGERGDTTQGAWAGHAELGWTFALPASPRLVGQLDYASGTDDGDVDSHTFDPLYGARRFDLIPTGIYGPFRRANIVSPGLRLVLTPLPTLKAQLKVRHWQLAQSEDAFVGTGLRDATGHAGSQLGQDVELSLQWAPLAWLAFDTGYDHWFKGSYFDDAPNSPSTGDTDYFYVATRIRF